MTDQSPTREAFFRWLFSLINARPDRAALAALRRGAGERPGSAPELFPHIEPHIWPEADSDAAYRVAALFALHHQGAMRPHSWPPDDSARRPNRSLGASLRMAARNDDNSLNEGMERRFAALLNNRLEDIDPHLRGLFTLMKSRNQETPVDYPGLYEDLVAWDSTDRRVKRRWAEGFWRGTAAAAAPDGSANIHDEEDAEDSALDSESKRNFQ